MKKRTPSDRQEFNVAWRGTRYRLASLSEHVRCKVPAAGPKYLLYDSMCRAILAPRAEVFISFHQGQTDATA
jgi:hypothetical protein